MSSLRGRTRDSSWQWLVIGVVLGFGCSGVFCLGLYAVGSLRITPPGASDAPTASTVLIVTTTPPPVTPTDAATATLAQAASTQSVAGASLSPSVTPFLMQPTDTNATQVPPPTQAANLVGSPIPSPVAATAVPVQSGGTQSAAPGGVSAAGAQSSNPAAPPSIPATDLISIVGGIFEMGTTQKEITQAVDDCQTRDKGKCDVSMADDSFPAHNVTVNAFRIEKFEVSYDQYVAFLNYLGPNSHLTGCGGEPCVAINDKQHLGSYIKFDGSKYTVSNELYRRRPVSFVTWYGADTYCKTIGRRLPTEAEWERAARNTDKRIYPWGNDWDPANPKAVTSSPKNQGGPDEIDSHPEGKSAEGVYNLAGNVAEWANDWYESGYYKTLAPNAIDPQGPAASSVGHKVVRGGSWDAKPFFARSVQRTDFDPLFADQGIIGFRCASGQDQSVPTKAPVSPAAGGAGTKVILPPKDQATATFTPGALPSGNG